jgi:hypothetical protein
VRETIRSLLEGSGRQLAGRTGQFGGEFDPTATFTVRCGNSFDAGLVAHANVRGSHVTMSRC